jgi:thiol:disulfide interchange protein
MLRSLGTYIAVLVLLVQWGAAGTAWAQAFSSELSSSRPSLGATTAIPQESDFLPVEQAYLLLTERNEDGTIRLYWQIENGYYLYRDQFQFSLRDSAGSVALSVRFPTGVIRTDEFFGEVEVYYGHADLVLEPNRPLAGDAQLTVRSQGCADAGLCYPPRDQAFGFDPSTGDLIEVPAAATAIGAVPASRTQPLGPLGFAYVALLAFLGGVLLNLMPCVFPVLALKIYGLGTGAAAERHRHGWAYSAGVVLSFLGVAAVLIGLQSAGQAVGWGFQLQSPGFVLFLAVLFTIMGLVLADLVEFGGAFAGAGQSLASRGGSAGSFFTGVLATVVASPCTAPFMGTAMGIAITQPAAIALLLFGALGAGMAAPMLALSYSPALGRYLPKPGNWMVTFKHVLAFPLFGTAIWLLWVFGRQTSVDGMALALLGLLGISLMLWLWRESLWRRSLAAIAAALALAILLEAPKQQSRQGETALRAGQVAYSERALRRHLGDGRAVFVDVTADWCITCLANERQVLHTSEITQAFAHHEVVYMVADWTHPDAEIAALLARHQRSGIPLYLLFDPRTPEQPTVLPQLLTRNLVRAALLELDRDGIAATAR